MGGVASLRASAAPGLVRLSLEARGGRARLRAEAIEGLEGRPFGQGMAGHWVQAYFLKSIVVQAGGTLAFTVEEELVSVSVSLPAD